MEAVVAVLRPRHESVILSKELLLTSYDILLVEMRVSTRDKSVQTVKQLPTTNISFENEPSDALSAFLYRFTGGDSGGITGN